MSQSFQVDGIKIMMIIMMIGAMMYGVPSSMHGQTTSKYGNEDITGGLLGVGFKAVSPWGPFIKVEGIQIHYNQIELEARPTSNNNFVKAKPYEESVRVAIGWNF